MRSRYVLPLLAIGTPAQADVIWDFLETSCQGCRPGTTFPIRLASLDLIGPTSSGYAFLGGGYAFDIPPVPGFMPGPLTLKGDDFAFTLYTPGGPTGVSTASPYGPQLSPNSIATYSIAWNEIGGRLDYLAIDYVTVRDSLRLDLTSGTIASDGTLDGCDAAECHISGFWRDTPVNEPAGLLAIVAANLVMIAWANRGKIYATKPLGWNSSL